MNKKLVLCMLIMLLVGCATPKVLMINQDLKLTTNTKIYFVPPANDFRKVGPKIAYRLRELGFEVKVVDSEKGFEDNQGSGFIIDADGHILTCEHVLAGKKDATIWLDGMRYEAKKIQTDNDNDVALLEINNVRSVSFKYLDLISTDSIKMGDDVYTIGFPLSNILGNKPRLNKGLISSEYGIDDDPKKIQITVEIQAGNSGSPLLNKDGQVIGIVQETINPFKVAQQTGGTLPQNVNFAIKTNAFKEFLDKNTSKKIISSEETKKLSFDEIKDCIVKVRSGIIPPGSENRQELVCTLGYVSLWDVWFRFQVFQLSFYDYKTGKALFSVGQYNDNLVSTENLVIDRAFKEIREKFEL